MRAGLGCNYSAFERQFGPWEKYDPVLRYFSTVQIVEAMPFYWQNAGVSSDNPVERL
jgi:hypothetical protein